jgi:signal transduction histidine kinase
MKFPIFRAQSNAAAGRSIRHYLARLVMFSVIPIVVATVLLVVVLMFNQRAAFDEALLDHAEVLTLAIERDLQFTGAVVTALQASPLLDRNEMGQFHDFASRVLESRPGTRLALVAPDGHVLLSTARPFGTVLPNLYAPPTASTSALQNGSHEENARSWRQFFAKPNKLVYSDVYTNLLDGEPTVAVRYPIVRDGQFKYAMALAIPTSVVQQQLISLQPNPSWITALVDARGVFIARSADSDRLAGTGVSATVRDVIGAGQSALRSGFTPDGDEVKYAIVRSELTGWWVTVAAPLAPITQRLVHAALLWLVGVLATLLIGMVLARRTWRQLSEPLLAMSRNARAFERNEPMNWLPSTITEFEDCRYAWTVALKADEQRRLAEAQRIDADARRQELEDANAQKDRLLAALSHELRNPLSAIATSTAVLARVVPADQRVLSMLDIITRQAKHLTRLVDDLLDLAGATFGKMRMSMELVDLHELVRLTIQPYQNSAITLSLNGQSAWVRGDAVRLDQVTRNLLDNAVKFTRPGGQIDLIVRADDETVALVVRDSGIGLSSDSDDDIFKPFVQTKQAIDRPQGGLGLGLALVRQIVLLHAGTVSAASAGAGQGTVLTVILPRVHPS